MSSKSTTANELQGMKNVLGGMLQMTIIKRSLSLWWRSVSRQLEEVILAYFRLSTVWIILRNPGDTG